MRNNAARRRQDSIGGERNRERRKQETVEVEDMEFTLVGPEIFRNGAPMAAGDDDEERKRTTSETSSQGPLTPDFSSITSGATRETFSLRSKSPSIHTLASQLPSSISQMSHQTPMSPSMSSPSPTPPTPLLSPFSETFGISPSTTSQTSVSALSEASSPPFSPSLSTPGFNPNGFPSAIAVTTAPTAPPGPILEVHAENHRQLELKWITAMSAVPSAESGKSRKIRKLVIDGIPASVRGVVWCV